jgi:UDP-glucose 4-epimerase
MKILVTGGAGFIGSNVVDGYLEAGHQIMIVDDLSTGKMENMNPKVDFRQIDIRSDEMSRLIIKERPDVINHHAAQISVPASVKDPLKDADINIAGLLNILESAVKSQTKKIIFISSGGAIYGNASEYPTSEDFRAVPISPYGISKFVSEYYLNYYRHQYGLDYMILRYANIYGPRQIPHGEAGVVAIFMENLARQKPSTLFHFPEDEDGMIRDYCYVGDVVKANLAALTLGSGDCCNIGTGRETKTSRLYDMIYDAMKGLDPDLPMELKTMKKEKTRPGDIPRSCLVNQKAKKLLDWSPETSLEEGVGLTLQWYSKNRA